MLSAATDTLTPHPVCPTCASPSCSCSAALLARSSCSWRAVFHGETSQTRWWSTHAQTVERCFVAHTRIAVDPQVANVRGGTIWRRFVVTQCERRILRRRLEGLELALEFIALVGQVQGNHVLGTCHTAYSFAELQQCSRREAGAHGNAQGRGRGQIRQIRRREHSVRPHAMYHSMTHFAASNRMRDQRSQRQVPGARRPPCRQVHL